MMTADWSVIEALELKIERAEKHLGDLQTFWDEFRDKAYSLATDDESERGYRIYRLRDAWDTPPDLPLMVGDAVHNLACALDHIAHRLVSVFTNGQGPFHNVYFPIGKTQKDFNDKLLRTAEYKTAPDRKINRLGDEVRDFLLAIEAYKGGKGAFLYYIHQLDIIDKHYVLPMVGTVNRSHSMSKSEIARYKSSFGMMQNPAFTPAVHSRAFLTDATERHFPLKAGDVLHRVPIAEVDEHMHFTFEIAFGEPKVVEGSPILPALYLASSSIRGMIRDLDAAGFLG